jgi:Zn-dependent protease
MRWPWKIGQLAGIDLRIHATFVLLLGWVLGSYWMAGNSIRALLIGIGFIFAVFACVVFHDVGHAATARKFGFRTRDITLLPIGSFARLERIPDESKHKLWVALAGSAVNALAAAQLYGWLALTQRWVPFGQLTFAASPFLAAIDRSFARLLVRSHSRHSFVLTVSPSIVRPRRSPLVTRACRHTSQPHR